MPVSNEEIEAQKERVAAIRAQTAQRTADRAKALQERENDQTYLVQLQEEVRLQREDDALAVVIENEAAAYETESAVIKQQIADTAAQLTSPPAPLVAEVANEAPPVVKTPVTPDAPVQADDAANAGQGK